MKNLDKLLEAMDKKGFHLLPRKSDIAPANSRTT